MCVPSQHFDVAVLSADAGFRASDRFMIFHTYTVSTSQCDGIRSESTAKARPKVFWQEAC